MRLEGQNILFLGAAKPNSGSGSIDENRVIIKSAEIPAASADELGKFYCYSGVTNQNYTHGYVYECVSASTSYEANIVYPHSTFASEDFYKAGQLIVDAGVADPTEVTGGTMTYALAGNLWSIVFTDANGNPLNTAYSIYTDDLEQDYDILPVIDPSEFVDGQVIDFSVASVIPHTNYTWARINLQPGSEHDLGFFDTVAELQAAHPTGTAGDFALIGATDTFWVWDTTTSAWIDSHKADAVTSVNGQTGAVSLDINDVAPTQTDKSGYVLGTDGFVAGWVKPEIVQRSTMPQASEDELGNVYQFVGTTDANYTNGYFYKCVSDGQNPATYSWTQVNVQPAPSGLPDQTGQSGKFLTTDGTDASWSDKPLVNTATGSYAISILGVEATASNAMNIGYFSQAAGFQGTAIGVQSHANQNGTAIGYGAWSQPFSMMGTDWSIAIGSQAYSTAANAIQLGKGTNNTENTLSVANKNGNYEMMSADGTIPTARLTKVNTTVTLAAANWSSNSQTVNVTGMTATGVVFPCPIPADQADYTSAGIICSAQAAGTLTFTCDTVPSGDIDVTVVMM